MKHLKNLPLEAYQHPLDNAAYLSLKKIPIINKVVDFVTGSIEKFAIVNRTGSCLKISGKNLPDLYNEFKVVSETIGMEKIPEFYVQFGYDIYSSTDGDKHPVTIINSGIVDLLTLEERKFYLGHELGHILAGHLQYLLVCRYWGIVNQMVSGADLLSTPLMYFSRMTEFTADRVGLLACQNIDMAISTMMKQAGIPRKYYKDIKVDSLKEQIRDFKQMRDEMAHGMIEGAEIMRSNLPWIVNRAAYLVDWYESGEYWKIIDTYGM